MTEAQQSSEAVVICPGQGAQAVGMGKKWCEASPEAKAVFDEADALLGDELGAPLSTLCFDGPADRLNRTDISQPAIYTASIASYRALVARGEINSIMATAGLSLGEYTALHLAGVFDFATGLRLVALRGRAMQRAAEASEGSMVALIGGDESQAEALCDAARRDGVLVCANFNAPGQIVLSGSKDACDRAVQAASDMGLRGTALTVAGAFHSPLMQPAAEALGEALASTAFQKPNIEVWSNVTAKEHDPADTELLKQRLVEQLVQPVRWAQLCSGLVSTHTIVYHELAPGSVLRGLMRRIDRDTKVISHDEP